MSPPRRNPRATRAAGFTLIEVLVALVIAAIGLQLAFEMFSTHTRMLDAGVQERRAVALADSLLAQVGTGIAVQPGSSSGSFDKDYRWRLHVTPFPRPGTERAERSATATARREWPVRRRHDAALLAPSAAS
jgi:general secretion pathway protein I